MLHFTKSLCTILLGVWLVLLFASESRADTVVFSNFSPGMTFDINRGISVQGGNVFGGQVPAYAFTPSETVIFNSAHLAMGILDGPNILQVVLMTSSGGFPGNVIESITLTNAVPPFGSGGIILANSALHPVLTFGTQYWLVVFPSDPNTAMAWNFTFNDFSTLGVFTHDNSLAGPWLLDAGPAAAFQINGDPVPEPTTMLLLGTGLAALGAAVRKRCKDERGLKRSEATTSSPAIGNSVSHYDSIVGLLVGDGNIERTLPD